MRNARVATTISIAILFLSIFGPSANAEQQIPIGIQEILNNISPESKIESLCTGDLNNDGLIDYGFVISYPVKLKLPGEQGESFLTFHQILVIKNLPQNRYQLIAKSLDIGAYPHGAPDLAVKKQSLFVSEFTNDSTSGETVTSQFKLRENGMMLIGEETHYWSPMFADQPGPKHDRKTSINLITGEKIVIDKINNKQAISKTKEPIKELIKLEEFGNDFEYFIQKQ